MIARCIHFDDMLGHATVVLEPCGLAKFLGWRTISIDLKRVVPEKTSSKCGWVTVGTGRAVEDLSDKAAIMDALDAREVGSPARWKRIAAVSGEAWGA